MFLSYLFCFFGHAILLHLTHGMNLTPRLPWYCSLKKTWLLLYAKLHKDFQLHDWKQGCPTSKPLRAKGPGYADASHFPSPRCCSGHPCGHPSSPHAMLHALPPLLPHIGMISPAAAICDLIDTLHCCPIHPLPPLFFRHDLLPTTCSLSSPLVPCTVLCHNAHPLG